MEGLPVDELDDRLKVTGTFPTASGSRPTFWAVDTLKLPDSYGRLGAILDRDAMVTHCGIDEGPSGDSCVAWDVEWVPIRHESRKEYIRHISTH